MAKGGVTMRTLIFILLGYLSGSVLYANVFSKILGKSGILERSRDQNPGTANAYLYGGFLCGTLTLIFDVGKGVLPVFWYLRMPGSMLSAAGFSLVLAAPVLGHVFPAWRHFRGGKGIAVTFGCLLGLTPYKEPVLWLAFFFVFFSTVLQIKSHFHRTAVTYLCTFAALVLVGQPGVICAGFGVMMCAVLWRLHCSLEERESFKVRVLWRH